MSYGYRRFVRPLGYGLVALVFVGAAWFLTWAIGFESPRIPERQYGEQIYTEYSGKRRSCEERPLASITDATARAAEEEDCKVEAESYRLQMQGLNQTSRNTDAAEETLRLTWAQTRIGFAQAVLTLFALTFTGWAAWEAGRAAQAAERAVSHADEVMRNDLRAYVHAERAEVRWGDSSGNSPLITLYAMNTGQTPAKWFGASCKVMATDAGIVPTVDMFREVDLSDCPLIRWSALGGNGATLSFYGVKNVDWDALRDAFDNGKTLNVVGVLRYETLFDEIVETEFWFSRRAPHKFSFKRPEGAPSHLAVYGRGEEIPNVMQRVPVALRSYERT